MWMTNSFPYLLLYFTRWCFFTNPSDRVLAIPFKLYQTVFGYPGRATILFLYAIPMLQWTWRYLPSGSYLMFNRYLLLIKALHINWLSTRHPFSSILASGDADKMVSPTRIMLSLRLFCGHYSWYYYTLDSIRKTACDEVWHNMSPVDSHYLLRIPIVYHPQPSYDLFSDFPGFIFLNASESFWSFICLEYLLFPK